MTHNLKTLGLALMAILAISALAAGATRAEFPARFAADGTSTKLDTKPDSAFQEFSSESGGVSKCSTVTGHANYEGESNEQTFHEVGYDNCTATQFGLTFPVTVIPTEEDCHDTLTVGTFTSAESLSHGSLHICARTINVYNASPHSTIRCQTHIPAQTINGITYRNSTNEGVMAVTIETNGVLVVETKTNLGTLGCNGHVTDYAHYTGSIWAKATNSEEKYVNATVTG